MLNVACYEFVRLHKFSNATATSCIAFLNVHIPTARTEAVGTSCHARIPPASLPRFPRLRGGEIERKETQAISTGLFNVRE